eukprot:TRINITY_DN7446_c0_g1_i1.p1 TRINITY_DN7446_c0_g1~~TRINITY_DN7446_c0_g1_i1.p1  ORF type:complete len:661 (-),score=128.85 TRINITY_DN7446_c0_g1_i1:43-2025(-)
MAARELKRSYSVGHSPHHGEEEAQQLPKAKPEEMLLQRTQSARPPALNMTAVHLTTSSSFAGLSPRSSAESEGKASRMLGVDISPEGAVSPRKESPGKAARSSAKGYGHHSSPRNSTKASKAEKEKDRLYSSETKAMSPRHSSNVARLFGRSSGKYKKQELKKERDSKKTEAKKPDPRKIEGRASPLCNDNAQSVAVSAEDVVRQHKAQVQSLTSKVTVMRKAMIDLKRETDLNQKEEMKHMLLSLMHPEGTNWNGALQDECNESVNLRGSLEKRFSPLVGAKALRATLSHHRSSSSTSPPVSPSISGVSVSPSYSPSMMGTDAPTSPSAPASPSASPTTSSSSSPLPRPNDSPRLNDCPRLNDSPPPRKSSWMAAIVADAAADASTDRRKRLSSARVRQSSDGEVTGKAYREPTQQHRQLPSFASIVPLQLQQRPSSSPPSSQADPSAGSPGNTGKDIAERFTSCELRRSTAPEPPKKSGAGHARSMSSGCSFDAGIFAAKTAIATSPLNVERDRGSSFGPDGLRHLKRGLPRVTRIINQEMSVKTVPTLKDITTRVLLAQKLIDKTEMKMAKVRTEISFHENIVTKSRQNVEDFRYGNATVRRAPEPPTSSRRRSKGKGDSAQKPSPQTFTYETTSSAVLPDSAGRLSHHPSRRQNVK